MTKPSTNPIEVFTSLKDKINSITDSDLDSLKEAARHLARKFTLTGQISAAKKLLFTLETIDKEKQLVKLGINTFLYKDDIDFYIDSSSDSTPVKLIELKNYPREIPDEVVATIEKTKDLFDEMYIIYTDYTGNEDKRIEAEKRSRDPILFGVFMSEQNRVCVDRFYYLADWEDEYCDLTLDKMLYTLSLNNRHDRKIYTPMNLDELKEYLANHTASNTTFSSFNFVSNNIQEEPKSRSSKYIKTSFFSKIKSIFSHGN